MADSPKGTKGSEPYLSYLLRLWRVNDEGRPVWRASLKSAHSGERLGFAGLEDLFDYLRAETGVEAPDQPRLRKSWASSRTISEV